MLCTSLTMVISLTSSHLKVESLSCVANAKIAIVSTAVLSQIEAAIKLRSMYCARLVDDRIEEQKGSKHILST